MNEVFSLKYAGVYLLHHSVVCTAMPVKKVIVTESVIKPSTMSGIKNSWSCCNFEDFGYKESLVMFYDI